MSRIVQISLAPKHTDNLVSKIRKMEGLISLRVQKNISIFPKGDVLSFELTNPAVNKFLEIMESEGLLKDKEVSITTSKPTNIISQSASEEILKEHHETSWEDVLKNLLHQSNMSPNSILIMFFAGLMAAIGISMNSLHIVIGAMIVAPGFEPISRLMMGIITQHRDWKNGGKDILTGYGAIILGAIAGAFTLTALGQDIIPGSPTYLPKGVLVEYWSSITATSLTISIVAAMVGGIIIMSNKTVLTAGVMVALALIPAASIIGMALVAGDLNLLGTAGIRLVLEISIVAIFSGLIFLWKRITTHKRRMRA